MTRTALVLSLTLLAVTSTLCSQTPSSTGTKTAPPLSAKAAKNAEVHSKPLTQWALGGGISLMGVNLQAATNLNRYLNLRGTGNVFSYTVNNINVSSSGGTNGLNLNGKVNFATAGASLDFYPFPLHGFRLSPGVLLYNQNTISANAVAASGTSFTLDNQKYYSDAANPLNVTGNLGLNTRKQAATLTTGWGNMLPRRDSHWSFPFELGAAFVGVPSLSVGLTGSACTAQLDAAVNGATCVNMATNATAQSNLNAQIAKYKSDLNPLQVYPILSFGLSYSFHIR